MKLSSFPKLAATAFAVAALSCGHGDVKPAGDPDVLVMVGDTALTLADVERLIPAGLDRDDSTAMFTEIVDDWIEGQLLEEVASRTLGDLDRIDRMVASYRRRLIVESYRRAMLDSRRSSVSRDSVEQYFSRYGGSMRLEQPLVKGIYIKLPANSPSLEKVRKLVKSSTPRSISELENNEVGEALHYDNFTDRWIEWGLIASQLPYRFYDADAFLESTRDFETSYNGNVYLLHVNGHIPSGALMPQEYAMDRIREVLSTRDVAEYERTLVKHLYQRALENGRLITVGYDPVEHKYLKQRK